MKIVEEGKPDASIKEVEENMRAKNPPLIHLSDEEKDFVEKQLEMFRKQRDNSTQNKTQLTNKIVATATDPGLTYDVTSQTTITDALSLATNIFVTDLNTTKSTRTINTTETSDSLFTFTGMTPQTSILDTPATNTFSTFPDFTELMKTTSEALPKNTVPTYDMALHTAILNESKTNTTAASMELEQLTTGADMAQKTQYLTL